MLSEYNRQVHSIAPDNKTSLRPRSRHRHRHNSSSYFHLLRPTYRPYNVFEIGKWMWSVWTLSWLRPVKQDNEKRGEIAWKAVVAADEKNYLIIFLVVCHHGFPRYFSTLLVVLV